MENSGKSIQPWLNSARTDIVFILLPPFVALLLVALFPAQFQQAGEIPVMYWLVLIVFIDVAHVYSTLYRTYFNPQEVAEKRTILLMVPLFCYVVGVLLCSIDTMLFWRILAYLAVFHFIRQQYGFMRLYSRYERGRKVFSFIDTLAIYTATLYPILFWHLRGDRNFSWFVEGDFLTFESAMLTTASEIVYVLILVAYLVKEIILITKTRKFNIPSNLLMIGTALSWYFGIVYFNGDLAFTTLNVISHGIPYMALIWFFEKEKFRRTDPQKAGAILKTTFSKYGVLFFAGAIMLFAYVEEGLWDGLVWKEHVSVFGLFGALPAVRGKEILSLLIPLLSLPQSTHYVLDGFIWKRNRPVGN